MMGARRKATLINMTKSLFEHERIETIGARAKEIRRVAEPLITLSKTDTVTARRRAYAVLGDRDVVGRLFKEIAPLFKNRTSGYTRIIPIGFRRGDGASMAILELTEKTVVAKLPKKKKDAKEASAPDVKDAKEAAPETPKKAAEEKKEARKEEPKIKHIPKSKQMPDEGRKHEKAKSEDKKAADNKGFMKNLRGLFRKRGDR